MIAQALVPRADQEGRVPVVDLTRDGKSHQIATMMQAGRAYGLVTFAAALPARFHDATSPGIS